MNFVTMLLYFLKYNKYFLKIFTFLEKSNPKHSHDQVNLF